LTAREVYGHLELPTGRNAKLTPGDTIVGVLGTRAALRGFCGTVPESLEVGGRLHLLNQGGVVGLAEAGHPTLGNPIELEVLGTVVRGNVPLRLADYAVPTLQLPPRLPPVVAIVGTCMSAGKTTAAAAVIRYLSQLRVDTPGTLERPRLRKVHAGKVSGVGCMKDLALFRDNGAVRTLSFLECGLPSTCGREEVALVAENILAHLSRGSPDWILIELGDGLLGEYGVDAILDHKPFAENVTACILAANDLVGALAAADALKRRQLKVVAVTGPVTDNAAPARKLRDAGLVPINAFADREGLGKVVAEHLLQHEAGLPPRTVTDGAASRVGPPAGARLAYLGASEHVPLVTEAARWIEEFHGRLVVLKIADELLSDESTLERILGQIAVLHRLGLRLVIVHGGGAHIARALQGRGVAGPAEGEDLRVTDEVLEVILDIVAGGLNRSIVAGLRAGGLRAVGFADGATADIRGVRIDPSEAVGAIESIRLPVATSETEPGWTIPVLPSVCFAPDGSPLAVASDRLASKIAVALGAAKLVLLVGVRGVQHDPTDAGPISELTASEARSLIAEGRVHGGMRQKLDECIEALNGGVPKVHIISGRDADTLLLEILTDDGCGTMLLLDRPQRP
jgi:acetylglutamate kinase